MFTKKRHQEILKIVSLSCFFFLTTSAVYGKESIKIQTKSNEIHTISKYWGMNDSLLYPKEWKALWIWRKGEPEAKNQFMLARKNFEVAQKPDKAILYITADNLYEVFVNGIFANRGPARCQATKQSFDVLDIAPLLKTGKNVLAIRALHHGSYITYNLPPRPGLLAQLEMQIGGNVVLIVSNSSFKVSASEWINTASESYCESIDFRKAANGWKDIGFDDSKWASAEELVSDKYLGWPGPSPKSKPITLTSPWKSLIPRDLPYLTETFVKAVKIHETGEIMELGFNRPVSGGLDGLLYPLEKCNISGVEAYQKNQGPLVIQNAYPTNIFSNEAIYSTYLILDFGELMHGYPHFEVEGEPGTIVEILYAPNLLRGKFPLRINSEGRPTRRPSSDRITLGAGQTVWDPMDMKYMRYLFIAVRNTNKPVKLHNVGLTKADYPFKPDGSFMAGNDEELNWIWQAGKNTLDGVTTDAFTDNYRERLQYSQTSYYASRCSYAAYGDRYLQRRYLLQIAQEQQNDGILPASAPVFETRGQRFLDASIFWILGLHDYFLHSGDTATVKELLPTAEKILNTFSQWENSEGFIDSPPYTYWIDHSDIDRYGANFSLNALYLLTMKDVLAIEEWLGRDQEAAGYKKRIQNLSSNLQSKFWNAENRLFSDVRIDEKLTNKFTEHSNSLAIVAGIASPEQQKAIVNELVENKSARLIPATLFMHYVIESLFMADQAKAAMTMLKDRYRHMKVEGNTLWEDWGQTTTYRDGEFKPISFVTVNQAENTYMTYSLSKWVLGFRPTLPGMTEVVISPEFGDQTQIAGSMPGPWGKISLVWKQTKTGKSLDIDVPDGVRVLIDLKNLDMKKKTILQNGKNFDVKSLTDEFMQVSKGKHRLEFF